MVDTRTLGTQKGTPSFQSPEQLTDMDVGTSADIYAFGGVTVGEKPVWEGLHPYQIITKVVTNGEKPNIGHRIRPWVTVTILLQPLQQN